MKVEHKLSATHADYVRQSIEQINQMRERYLALLGQAKEIEIETETVRRALGQQLALIERAEGLPRPLAPYRLNPEGTALVGEIADAPEVEAMRNGNDG